ncbi:MAG: long-chain-fatty-acid--CoA ligase [Nitriliruptorales bacterium]|nr:long-chain-fatty-acid--CoA ligase [Nitriliruptorales bacterium]
MSKVNLADRLRAAAARLPEKPALVLRPISGGGAQVTYHDLDERVDRAAGAFQGLGLDRGERVALMLGNSEHFVEAFYGAMRAGLVVVPLNTTYTTNEVAQILTDADAAAIVVGEAYHDRLAGIKETLPALEHVVVAGASSPPLGAQTWKQFLGTGGPFTEVEVDEDDLALLPYTSGTTGRPKGAMLSHANLLANHHQMEQTRLSVEELDVVLCVLPLFHIYSLNVAMAFSLSRGATVLIMERFDPLQSLDAISSQRVSVVIGAPPIYIAWLNTPGVEEYDLASVRYAVSGAAPLPRQVLTRFESELGITIWEGYGLTETSPLLTTVAMDDRPRPGSVGCPVPGVELRLVDDKGADVRAGDPGEVVVRGPNVFSGYWQDADATAEVLEDDGWFHTGDVGLLDDGHLYLVDRKKDMVLVSGFNVYPREVEEVLYRHPKIAAAAVVGTPHPYTGEAVKAVVVLREGEEAAAEDITDFCRRYLARFKCPEVVEFVESLPTNPSGKVLRRELRKSA